MKLPILLLLAVLMTSCGRSISDPIGVLSKVSIGDPASSVTGKLGNPAIRLSSKDGAFTALIYPFGSKEGVIMIDNRQGKVHSIAAVDKGTVRQREVDETGKS